MTLLVKICGLSTADALDAALDAGADLVGFVFFPPSPRNIVPAAARDLGARVKDRALKVALTVDADDALFEAIVEELKPDILQLHGHESPERVAQLKRRYGIPIMKAIPVETRSDLAALDRYRGIADRFLFDARAPREATRPGGLGKPFDWHLLENVAAGPDYLLSGGLDAEQCCGRARDHRCAGRGRVLRRRKRARRQGPGEDRRLRQGRAGGLEKPRRSATHSSMSVLQKPNSFRSGPDEHGHFGLYGGRFVAETLMPLILELEQAYARAKADPAFQAEMDGYLAHYIGRPSALYFAERLTGSLSAAPKSTSSAKTSTTPAPTR